MTTTVIAKGNGKKIKNKNYVIVEYKAETWSGQTQMNTFTNKTVDFQKVNKNKSTIFSQLINLPINSRVLIQTP